MAGSFSWRSRLWTDGEWLPQATIDTIKAQQYALKDRWLPQLAGFRSLNVTLRQTLDLYACVQTCSLFYRVPSPLKQPEKTDMVIFRENTEDVYAGIEFAKDDDATQRLIQTLQADFAVKGDSFS